MSPLLQLNILAYSRGCYSVKFWNIFRRIALSENAIEATAFGLFELLVEPNMRFYLINLVKLVIKKGLSDHKIESIPYERHWSNNEH